jgi:S-DNA-T family DNA segregation ATPase FtsK/SpoIIIE
MADLMMVAGKDIEGASSGLRRWRVPPASMSSWPRSARRSMSSPARSRPTSRPALLPGDLEDRQRTILGEQGAEQLLGMGDMLYMAGGGRIQRVHGPFVSDKEVEDIVSYLKTQGVPEYLDTITEDDDEDDGRRWRTGGHPTAGGVRRSL